MANNDIYNSKLRYETLIKEIRNDNFTFENKEKAIKENKNRRVKYWIKNKANLKYFEKLINEFEYKDLSFIRRNGLILALKQVCHFTEKDLKDLELDEVKNIVREMNKVNKSVESRRNFIVFNRANWKIILPERDYKGRIDNMIMPYIWRVKWNEDKAIQRDKKDKLTQQEYDKIQRSCDKDPRIQLYFCMLFECLARPQELCYLNIEDVKVFDNYARVRIAKHGKEGTKDLQIIDGYYYLTKWLNQHPQKDKPEAPLFVTISNNQGGKRLTPKSANDLLKNKLKKIGINKPITNYSFKRNGVTTRYINGDSPQDIQKIAGWTSTLQLKTYDLSNQEEFFEKELIKAGVIKPNMKEKEKYVTYKQCAFCNSINPKSNNICYNCNRSLNREDILAEEKRKDDEINKLKEEMLDIKEMLKEMTFKGQFNHLKN